MYSKYKQFFFFLTQAYRTASDTAPTPDIISKYIATNITDDYIQSQHCQLNHHTNHHHNSKDINTNCTHHDNNIHVTITIKIEIHQTPHYHMEYTLIDNGSQLVVSSYHLIFEYSILMIMMELDLILTLTFHLESTYCNHNHIDWLITSLEYQYYYYY